MLVAAPHGWSEVPGVLTKFSTDILRAPLEPTRLSLDPDVKNTSPLSVRVSAPQPVTDVVLTSSPWFDPFRLARVVVRLPATFDANSEDAAYAIENLMGNMSVVAELINTDVHALLPRSRCLQCLLRRLTDDPQFGCCVLVDVLVPAGTTLLPGAAIALSLTVARSTFTLRIPAVGHVHSHTCNHSKQPMGVVFEAAKVGDASAVEVALAAGQSTEETDEASLL